MGWRRQEAGEPVFLRVAQRRAVAMLAVALLLFALGCVAVWTKPDTEVGLEASLDAAGEWRLPGASGGAVELEWDRDGSRLLVMEVGVQGLRAHVLGADLADQGALVPVELAWTPRGASWADTGRWVLVWGSTGGGGDDVLLAWNTTSLDGTGSPLPPSSELGLPRIDAAKLVAGERILVVAGRDQNGTSRVRMYELDPFRSHRDEPFPGNATVLEIGLYEPELLLIGSSGVVVLYETRDWTQDWSVQVVQGTPTAWCFGPGPTTVVGDDAGHLGYLLVHGRTMEGNATADGPVRGVTFAEAYNRSHVVAVGGPSAPSELQVWMMGGEGPLFVASFPGNGTVTWAVDHPTAQGEAMLALEDGTVRSLLVSIERVFHRDRGPFQRAVPILFVLMLSLVVAAAVVLWRDRRATAGAGRPEGSEGPEGLGPLPPHRKG